MPLRQERGEGGQVGGQGERTGNDDDVRAGPTLRYSTGVPSREFTTLGVPSSGMMFLASLVRAYNVRINVHEKSSGTP